MKIAVVIDNMGIGGAQAVCVDYINILKLHGNEVDLYNLNPKETILEKRISDDVKIYHYKMPLNAAPSRFFILQKAFWYGKFLFPFVFIFKKCSIFFRKLFFKYKKNKYDIVIAFAGHYNDLTFVSDNFIKGKKKLCWTHGALFQNCVTSDGFLYNYLKIKNVIVLNETAQEEVLASNHYLNLERNLNINKLFNPISMEKKLINIEKVNRLKDEYGDYIIMVARFAYPHKDHYTVVKAINYLKQKYGFNKKVLFLGNGPEEEKVRKYVNELNLDNQVIFMGGHEDIQNYYKAAHLLVHSSVAFEGLPLILVEAMFYDLPVISSDTMVGPRDVLDNGKYGMLYPVKDYVKLAEEIYILYTDDEKYNYYVKQSRKRKNDFSYETIWEKFDNILKSLK